MADEVFNSQTGLRSQIHGQDYTGDNLFTGVWSLGQNNIQKLDPFIGGYAYWIWTALPKFMSYDQDWCKNFRLLTERNLKSFDGINDFQLDTDAMTNGFAGNELAVATNMKKDITTFTMKHQELVGSPVREAVQQWVCGIRDPETGLATYNGQIANGKFKYSMANHSGEGIYIVTDPSGLQYGIEYAAYFTNVFPTKVPQSHLGYSAGDHALAECDIEYRGSYHQSAKINKLAYDILEKYIIKRTYGEYGNMDQDFVAGSAANLPGGLAKNS